MVKGLVLKNIWKLRTLKKNWKKSKIELKKQNNIKIVMNIILLAINIEMYKRVSGRCMFGGQ